MLARFRERVAAGKAFRFPSGGSSDVYGAAGVLGLSMYGWALPGTRYDWQRESGPPWLNGIVLTAINWITRVWPEASQVVFQLEEDGTEKPIKRHPALDLLARPNEDYDDSVLWMGTHLSLISAGNAYWYKIRDRMKRVVQLQYLPHYMVEPYWPRDGSRYIDGYAYKVGGGEKINLAKQDVVHLRRGIDPLNVRKGMGDLTAEYRALGADNEGQTYHASILKNMGIPGVIMTPEDADANFTPEQAETIKRLWTERFTTDGRGDPLATAARIKIQKLAFSPEELALDLLSRMPVSRICAAIGIHPMVLGYPSEQQTYSNYQEAVRGAWENTLIPQQTALDSQLTLQLMPDFTTDRNLRLGHDHSQVAALQDDKTALYKRVTEAVGGPWLSLNEGRKEAGLQPRSAGDDLYPKQAPPAFGGGGDQPQQKPPPGGEPKSLREELAAKWRERRELAVNGAGNGR